MRSPEEIKKAMNGCHSFDSCSECPYFSFQVTLGCKRQRNADALALIQQLQADNAEKDERILQLEKRVIHLEALNQSNLTTITMQERTRARLQEQISQLESHVPSWISVEERLPEDDANVLVYAIGNNENSCIAMTSYTHNLHGFHIEGWRSPWQYFFYEHKVTHWMPLPTPPEKEATS